MYSAYARYYDAGQLHFSVLMYTYLADILDQHAPCEQPGRWVDLACGTGTLALMLADDGWDVLGIDAATAMLQEAQRKARRSAGLQRSVRFRRADMRDWQVDTPVDVVSCCFDSLNYLLDLADIEATFRAVHAALRPQGLWLFDMNTPYFLETVWQPVEVEERAGYAHVMRSDFDAERCISWLTLIGFSRRADGLYARFEEQHAERGYSAATVQHALEAVGFSIEACYDCFVLSEPVPESHRWFWVARKAP